MVTFCRITFIVWLAFGMGVVLAEHGKPRTGNYHFGVSLVSTVLQLLLLWGGGFFS